MKTKKKSWRQRREKNRTGMQESRASHTQPTVPVTENNLLDSSSYFAPFIDILSGEQPDKILNGEIPIEVLDLASLILKEQFALRHGLLPPSYLYANALEGQPLDQQQRIPKCVAAVQIHYVTGHYLVSYQFANTITVYDSLPCKERLGQVRPQLDLLFEGLSLSPPSAVHYCVPQDQGYSTLCGAFAVAYTVILLEKQVPLQTTSFSRSLMRQHLLKCIVERKFTSFPKVTLQRSSEFSASDSVAQYLLSQSSLKISSVEQQREMNRIKNAENMKTKRKAMTKEQWEVERAKNAENMKTKRKAMTKERREVVRATNAENIKTKRKAMTTERREVERAKNAENMNTKRKAMTKEQREVERAKIAANMKTKRRGMTNERREVERTKIAENMKTKRRGMTNERREVERAKFAENMKTKRRGMTNERREVERAKNAENMKTKRSTMTKEREVERAKNSENMKTKRTAMTKEQREVERAKNAANMRSKLKAMTTEQRQLTRNKHAARMINKRKTMSEEQKERERNKHAARMINKRKTMSEEQKERERNKHAARMINKRKTMSEEQKERERNKHAARMINKRKTMSEEQKERQRNKHAAAMMTRRRNLPQLDTDMEKKKNAAQMFMKRGRMSNEKKDAERMRNRAHMTDVRRTVPEEKRNIENNNLKHRRSSMTRTEKIHLQLKDKTRKEKKRNTDSIEDALNRFRKHCQEFPEYVCTCCNKLLYRKSVNVYNKSAFHNTSTELLKNCIPESSSASKDLWICFTCQRHLKGNKMPPQATANGLGVEPVPAELQGLSSLEQRLVSQRYPFMKLLVLPKGQQSGIKGAVVNVPVKVEQVVHSLPKTPTEAGFIPLKLKRKVKYKGHHTFQYIRPRKVFQAIKWLQKNNDLYKDVDVRQDWETMCKKEDEEVWHELTQPERSAETEQVNQDQEQPDPTSSEQDVTDDYTEDQASQLRGVKFDTCVQPSDPAVDRNKMYSLAPGEGQTPMSILTDANFEALSFPCAFPTGKFGFTSTRTIPISAKKYFQSRLLNKDRRFAENIEYIFVAQFVTEWQQVLSSVSIALRKSTTGPTSGPVFNAGFFKNPDRVRALLRKDEAYNFLQPIRGSPPYWQQVMYKLLAAIKQLGPFTWFLTLSAADLRWTDTLQAIARQQGKQLSELDIQEMTWAEKCSMLKSDPVTAARHFQYKVQCLFTDVILSPAEPLGKVTQYFYRIEFQQRGSPHAHAVLWIQNAPTVSEDSQKVTNFVDKYVSASIPSDDPDLQALVKQLQSHSHSPSCRKKNTTCRFNFPKPPTDKTVLATAAADTSKPVNEAKLKSQSAILAKVKETLKTYESLENVNLIDLLEVSGITYSDYIEALSLSTKDPILFLKRKPSDVFVNNFNKDILSVWQANMDLQFVVSPYAAIHYVTSYVTKDEREMGLVLQSVSKEMKDQSIRSQMKKCADAFANSRSVSAQEAVYRLLGLPLHSSNFSTVWIPTGYQNQRIRIVKPQQLLASLSDEEEQVFARNWLERYSQRPDSHEHLSLVKFAMWYELMRKSTNTSDDHGDDSELTEEDHDKKNEDQYIILKKHHELMKKRSTPKVVRYHQCSLTKDPELFYHNKILLFLPWRSEPTDILGSFQTFGERYHSMKDALEAEENSVFGNTDLIEEAINQFRECGPPINAWDEINPEAQQSNEDAADEGPIEDENHAVLHPEDRRHSSVETPVATSQSHLAVELIPQALTDLEYRTLVQSLNGEQRQIFQHMLTWCNKVNTTDKKPTEYLFVTGGAGTGKSHLIKCLYTMTTQRLSKAGDDPTQDYVLLTAPTGTAACNITGITLHSAFLLPLGQTKSYKRLSDDKRNTLRTKLAHLRLLIIDEISMVGSDLLQIVDRRLQEIKMSSKPFGGVSVVAFGDLYQLPPVAQKFVFELPSDEYSRLAGCVWQDLFKCFELQTVMRQKEDQDFALLLNRVRKASHTPEDIRGLQTRSLTKESHQYSQHALHIFARNKNVENHNTTMLQKVGYEVVTLNAKETKPACLEEYSTSDDPRFTGGLSRTIQLCEQARVMLNKNIDVCDGLVNGAQGTVTGFSYNSAATVVAVLVKFDRPNTGLVAFAASKFDLSSYPQASVPITPVDVKFSISKRKQGLDVLWTQFPLKLCWATTIHKVQGLTLDTVVISFESQFCPGQAYVALSRCKTMDGLQLLEFDASKIRANKNVQKEMSRLKSEMPFHNPYASISSQSKDSICKIGIFFTVTLQGPAC